MPTPEQVYQQITKLTSDLVRLSLCDRQQFPSLRDLGQGIREVGLMRVPRLSDALKNVPYVDIYRGLQSANTYNMQMLDGALIQMMYRFRHNRLETHRLAFFPSPFLEEFQNNPTIYLEEEIFAEVVMKNIVPVPLRFDFDDREAHAVDVEHPKSHLTLGQYKNCRIPVSAPLMPHHFMRFILGSFYNTASRRCCPQWAHFCDGFDLSITDRERDLLHIQVPGQSDDGA
ncbi:MAG: DUF2290 domain-containing protein [Magnetococcales bacterium]|nr:DUF2290 domain-containing protein [Magnetococcales bacterium]